MCKKILIVLVALFLAVGCNINDADTIGMDEKGPVLLSFTPAEWAANSTSFDLSCTGKGVHE